MHTHSVRNSLAAAFVGGLATLAFSAAPAAAIECPPGASGDPLVDYCFVIPDFVGAITADGPEAWYRLGDPMGAEEMEDDSGNFHHGEYKNEQDSGPIGISGDGDRARDFWGVNGYGYANDIPAPGPDNFYSNYTMEAWFYLEDTDGDVDIHDDATIMQFGGAGAVYIKSNTLRFRNGPDDEILAPDLFEDEKWYMVIARKSGNQISVWLKESPPADTPTWFNPTPSATGLSHYRPGGSPTFYVGYGTWAPWFNGALDEVVYFKKALTTDQVAYHYYADPVPEITSLNPPAKVSTPGGQAPSTSPTFSADSSNPAGAPAKKPAAKSKAAKLKKAKAEVKRLNGLVKKAKRWVGSLKHNVAPRKAVKKAEAKLKSLQKKLTVAKKRVKTLS